MFKKCLINGLKFKILSFLCSFDSTQTDARNSLETLSTHWLIVVKKLKYSTPSQVSYKKSVAYIMPKRKAENNVPNEEDT